MKITINKKELLSILDPIEKRPLNEIEFSVKDGAGLARINCRDTKSESDCIYTSPLAKIKSDCPSAQIPVLWNDLDPFLYSSKGSICLCVEKDNLVFSDGSELVRVVRSRENNFRPEWSLSPSFEFSGVDSIRSDLIEIVKTIAVSPPAPFSNGKTSYSGVSFSVLPSVGVDIFSAGAKRVSAALWRGDSAAAEREKNRPTWQLSSRGVEVLLSLAESGKLTAVKAFFSDDGRAMRLIVVFDSGSRLSATLIETRAPGASEIEKNSRTLGSRCVWSDAAKQLLDSSEFIGSVGGVSFKFNEKGELLNGTQSFENPFCDNDGKYDPCKNVESLLIPYERLRDALFALCCKKEKVPLQIDAIERDGVKYARLFSPACRVVEIIRSAKR